LQREIEAFSSLIPHAEEPASASNRVEVE